MDRASDIIELILEDHRQIRRLRDALEDAVRYYSDSGPGWIPAQAWQRLADLLEAHARAEEEICYLPMFGPGPQARDRRWDAVAEHDDIREAAGEASMQPAGSALWWRAVKAALMVSARHLDREEYDVLAHGGRNLTAGQRRELGRQWAAFVAAWRQDGAPQSR